MDKHTEFLVARKEDYKVYIIPSPILTMLFNTAFFSRVLLSLFLALIGRHRKEGVDRKVKRKGLGPGL